MPMTNAEMDEAERILRDEGTDEFYGYIESKGDKYGRLGQDVTRNEGWQGQIANGFAESGAKNNNKDMSHGSVDWKSINQKLAEEHLAATRDNQGNPPNRKQIQDYHNDVYDNADLDLNDWFPNKMLNESSDPEALWNDWMQNEGTQDLLQDAMVLAQSGVGTLFPPAFMYQALTNPDLLPDSLGFAKHFLEALGKLSPEAKLRLANDVLQNVPDDYGWAWDNPGAVFREIPEWVLGDIADPFHQGELNQNCPIVIDMDGDGIELAAVNGAGSVYFDMDNDGFAEASGWVTGGDALLAMDRNNNGTIDAQSELFGNSTKYANGFEALKALDSNKDNKITSADADFAKLRLWIDANADGASQAGELHTLASKSLTSINLAYTNVNKTNQGHAVRQESTVTIGGKTRAAADVWFNYDDVNTVYNGNYTLDVRALFLPTLRGYGTLPDLHIAMSKDEVLLKKVELLAVIPGKDVFSPAFDVRAKITDTLYRWAGVDEVNPTSRGAFDARKLGFLEKFIGEGFNNNSSVPVISGAAAELDKAWENALSNLTQRILFQSGQLKALINGVSYNPVSDVFSGTASVNLTELGVVKPVYSNNPETYVKSWWVLLKTMQGVVDLNALPSADKTAINTMIVNSGVPGVTFSALVSAVNRATGSNIDGTNGSDLVIGEDSLNSIKGLDGNDTIYAFGGNDNASGGNGDDRIYAGEGNDTVNGDAGNDTLAGGAGNDSVYGGLGNDTVIYDSGLDKLYDDGGTDTIRIASSTITEANMVLRRSSTSPYSSLDLDILLNGTHAITIVNQFAEGKGFETIRFANGTSFNLANASYANEGTANADKLYGIGFGGNSNDVIRGYGGNDTIFAYEGNDTITGGTGNDSLDGGKGNDLYIYNVGDGLDTITDIEGTDTIQLGAGFAKADVSYQRSGRDLLISLKGTQAFKVVNHFVDGQGIDIIKFADNSTTTLGTFNYTVNGSAGADNLLGTDKAHDTLNGLDGDDTLTGMGGNDVIDGGKGKDRMDGGNGDDTFIVRVGDSLFSGMDSIQGGAGTDTLKLTGVLPQNVKMWTDYRANITLWHADNNALTITGTTSAPNIYTVSIERIVFDNGTVWDLSKGLPLTDSDEAHQLYGFGANDTIDGRGGDDAVYGQEGNDTITGGTGQDYLMGGTGDDTYVFRAGDSLNDTPDSVYENFGEGTDTIKLTGGILSGNVRMWAEYNGGLTIQYTANDRITVYGAADTVGNPLPGIERISFDNGTVWDLTKGLTMVDTDESHQIYGFALNDVIDGRGGDDSILSGAGNDTITGGKGMDALMGGTGNDTYIFRAGDSLNDMPDQVYENFGEGSTLFACRAGFCPVMSVCGAIITGRSTSSTRRMTASRSMALTTRRIIPCPALSGSALTMARSGI